MELETASYIYYNQNNNYLAQHVTAYFKSKIHMPRFVPIEVIKRENAMNLIKNISGKFLTHNKIKTRLIWAFIIFSLVPLTITGVYSYYESSNAIKNKISTYAVQVMEQIGENIDRELAKLEYDSIEIQFSDIVQNTLLNFNKMGAYEIYNAQNKMQEEFVKKFSFLHDVSDVLLYTNSKEKIIAYGDRGFTLKLKKEFLDDFLIDVVNKKGVAVWAAINEEDEERLVEYATSSELMNRNNGVILGRAIRSLMHGDMIIGSLIIRTNERFFSNIYRNIDIGSGSDIFVMDNKGIVVSSRNPKIPVAEAYRDKKFIEEVKRHYNQGNTVFDYNIDGNDCLVAFSHLEKADWFVISTIPYSYINSESKKTSLNIFVLAIVFFVLAVFLSNIYYTHVTSPLTKLVSVMNEVRKGDLSITMEEVGTDEISEVIKHFNIMLNDINRLLQDIKVKEKQKRKAELKALQAQINPHFLSNTLNTIKWLANVQKAENIESIITSLIQLLHSSMGKGGDYVSVREEIEYIKHYINIQEYRYFNKFKVLFEIEDCVMDCMIPKFLLQPVIENALIHGIEPMEGQGVIVVKAFAYEDTMKITITDNGVGIPEDKLDILNQKPKTGSRSYFSGMGIRNVHERIVMNYGEPYGLQIQSVPNLYTTVEITLPINKTGGVD